jgi:endonuclease/exonuclease/phosphatase family metal-dependent hydrolase
MKHLILALLQLMGCLFLTAQSIQDLSFGTEATLDIMTWNIEQFPKNGETTVTYVKDIIEALDVDIVALQEVNDITYFNQMVNDMSAYAGYLESSYFAGLAYIYKPDVIQINAFYEIYTTSEYWSYFPRSPMVMDLTYKGERFIVINNHFKCCGDGILDLNDRGDEETRRFIASDYLKSYIDTNFPDVKVIVLGDLNDSLTDDSQNNVFQNILYDSLYVFADLDIANGSPVNWSYPTWPSHLDHILITDELFPEFEHVDSDIQTLKPEDYLSGGWQVYEANISDHRPVALKLVTEGSLKVSENDPIVLVFVNYPNPFSSETRFSLPPTVESYTINIYDLKGQHLHTLKGQEGQKLIEWDTALLPNGVYVAQLICNSTLLATRKLLKL